MWKKRERGNARKALREKNDKVRNRKRIGGDRRRKREGQKIN